MENNEYFNLLKLWADSLIDLQITDSKRKEFYGGIMCPACMGIHGRIGDVMYPFVYLYSKTGDKKYYNSAKLCYTWLVNNMLRDRGRFINDANSTWYGITVFFNIQLGELLLELKDFIEPEDYEKWMQTYKDTCEFICHNIVNTPKWVINYHIGTAASMAVAYKILGDEKYSRKAKEFIGISLAHITEEGFIWGEGKPSDKPTSGGFYSVDLGYNVEESLPNLSIYFKYTGDEEVKNVLLKGLRVHLEFMLPDGGWDNSWGVRCAKWTYWGSRTSDGCQPAYEFMADYDDTFFEAAHRNFELYKKCTINGLLAGGLHHDKMNEPVCIHHTFTHVKGLLCMAKTNKKRKENIKLPREVFDGIKQYESMNVALASKGDFTATFSCDDFTYIAPEDTPSGGTVTLLYHKKAGLILTGGQNEYELVEPNNMQVPLYFTDVSPLVRLEVDDENGRFRNTYDTKAVVSSADCGDKVLYIAQGHLRDYMLNGIEGYKTEYQLSKDEFVLTASTEAEGAKLVLPIVTVPEDKIEVKENCIFITKENSSVEIECSQNIMWDKSRGERIFTCNGGFATARFVADAPKNEEVTVKIKVK